MTASVWLFVLLAALLAAAFGGSLYWAGLRGQSGANNARRGPALALALVALLALAALYGLRGTPAALNPPPAQSASGQPDPQVMVQRLADHLKQHPDDLDGWLMLARSYMALQRYPEAEAAYEHAQARVMQDSDLLVSWIELRVMLAGRKFDSRTQELVQHAATLAPDDPQVMLLRLLVALDRGDKAESDALLAKLHQRYPSGSPDRESLDAVIEKWTTRNDPAQPGTLNPSGQPAANAPAMPPDMQQLVQRLADRLQQHPEDLDGWLMLARSYAVLGRYADADAAFQHAQSKATQDSAQLAIWIEMRLRLNNLRFDARSTELLAQAAKLAPDNSDVLLLRALAAYGRGDKSAGDALVGQLHTRFPADSPQRQQLDAALQDMLPPGAADKP